MNEQAIIQAAVQLTRALDAEGPHGQATQAIAAEIRSAGIEPSMFLGLEPWVYEQNRDIAAAYICGQILSLLDGLAAEEKWTDFFVIQGCINVSHRFCEELLGAEA